MQSFCTASALKVNLYRDDCPEVLKLMRPILESHLPWGDKSDASLQPSRKETDLSFELTAAVQEANRYVAEDKQLSPRGASVQDLIISKRTFSVYRPSNCNSNGLIYSKPLKTNWFSRETSQVYLPARIEKIVLCQDGRHWLAVRRLMPSIDPSGNPFANYPDFGVEIWSDKFANQVEVIPVESTIYHAIYQPWDQGYWIIKKLDRVSAPYTQH